MTHSPWNDDLYGNQLAPPRNRQSQGMAIASLVLGILAMLVCLIPVLNIVGMFLAFVAGVLGVVSLMTGRGGRGMAIGGTVLAAISLIIAIVVNLAFNSFMQNFGGGETSTTTSTTSSRSSSSSSSEPSSPRSQSPAPAGELALGQSASTGTYEVTVTKVNPNGDAIVAEANPYNDPPEGRYVIVDVTVKYTGSETGTPWMDVNLNYLAGDARNYTIGACAMDNGAMNVPELRNGGTGSYAVCFDVPVDAIEGGTVQASELGGDGPEPVWRTS